MTEQEYIAEVERCRSRMVSIALSYIGNVADAEDVVQDVLTKLWLLHSQLTSPLDALATAATKNRSVDILRQRKRHQSNYTDIESVNAQLEQIESEENVAAEREERIAELMNALDKLPSSHNIMLRMHYLKGMSTIDMARVTGATEVAVRQTLCRARSSLFKQLTTGIVATLIIAIGAWSIANAYTTQRTLSLYEGSYMIVDGKRIDDIRQIRSEIEQTLSFANDIEAKYSTQNAIANVEDEALSGITDEDERIRIKQLLSD